TFKTVETTTDITAKWIKNIDASGDFGATLTLTDKAAEGYSLNTADIKGTIGQPLDDTTPVVWKVFADVNSIKAATTKYWQFKGDQGNASASTYLKLFSVTKGV